MTSTSYRSPGCVARLMPRGSWLARRLVVLCALTPLLSHGSEPDFSLVGFAAVEAHGLKTTTGGGDAKPTLVRTAAEFLAACDRTDIKDKKARDNSPRVIVVAADLDLGELGNMKGGAELKRVGIVRVRPHTTIYAPGAGATIRRGTIEIHGAWNIIIRNLRFRDLWEFDPTGEYDKLGWDYLRVTDAGKTRSHHIWVDHCDFEKAYDGLLDIVHGSDCVTVSWCRFAGDARGPQKKAMLISHSTSASAAAVDKGRLNVTLHHNWFENIEDRAPRARFGNIHVFNQVVDGSRYATMSVAGAVTLVENSVYRNARVATSYSHAKDNVRRNLGGTICLVNCLNERPARLGKGGNADEQFELDHNFTGNVERESLQFNAAADFAWANRHALPYAYRADPVAAVEARVKAHAGVGRLKLPMSE